MRVLVTGSEGFTGRFMCEALESAGHAVVRASHRRAERSDLVFDLTSREETLAALAGCSVDAVVHLAAIAFVGHGDVDELYRANIVGTRNLLEASSKLAGIRHVLLASSANIYGNADSDPITEATPPAPANDYAVSKLAMENMAKLWSDRLPITVVRPFNYTGAGQSEQFLVPKIVSHFKARAPVISLGNTHVVRDFQDVRDVVTVYRQLIEGERAGGVFNVCSGVGHSLGDIIRMLGALTGHDIDVVVDPRFVRANEVHRLIGSRARLDVELGGTTQFRRSLEETLAWMMAE